jgi:hypothetical protein
MMRRLLTATFVVLALFTSVSAYDAEYVHMEINKAALAQSNVDNVLLKYLGFKSGIAEQFKGKTVKYWITEGGRLEDSPFPRSFNHFHDPLEPWGNAGLKDSSLGFSSLLWAQDQSSSGIPNGGDWSWKKARDLYYRGLTGAGKSERERNLTDAFRALGQIMHLLADASVPAHGRNDIHILPIGSIGPMTYESWAKENSKLLTYTGFAIEKSIFSMAVTDPSAPVPISALWDQNRYNGTNPADTRSGVMGLSEYVNANFFSADTIFKKYPHPAKENTNAQLIEQTARDGQIDKVWYVKGYAVERLAAYSYLNEWLVFKKWLYNLDHAVYEDYAKELIPRALGYSTALLDYFFKGDIEMSTDDPSGNTFTIKNNTDEAMNGRFELWYDDQNDQRKKIWAGSLNVGAKGEAGNISFSAPSDAKKPGAYMLVFQGTMGREAGAVVGRVIKAPLSIAYIVDGGYVIADEKLNPIKFTATANLMEPLRPSPDLLPTVTTQTVYDPPSFDTVSCIWYGDEYLQEAGTVTQKSTKVLKLGSKVLDEQSFMEKTTLTTPCDPCNFHADIRTQTTETSGTVPYTCSPSFVLDESNYAFFYTTISQNGSSAETLCPGSEPIRKGCSAYDVGERHLQYNHLLVMNGVSVPLPQSTSDQNWVGSCDASEGMSQGDGHYHDISGWLSMYDVDGQKVILYSYGIVRTDSQTANGETVSYSQTPVSRTYGIVSDKGHFTKTYPFAPVILGKSAGPTLNVVD